VRTSVLRRSISSKPHRSLKGGSRLLLLHLGEAGYGLWLKRSSSLSHTRAAIAAATVAAMLASRGWGRDRGSHQ